MMDKGEEDAWFSDQEDGGMYNNGSSSNNNHKKDEDNNYSHSGARRKKLNGYGVYALQRKKEVEQEKGGKLGLPFDQVLKIFDQDWRSLSIVQRNWWKSKAKGIKVGPYPKSNGNGHPNQNLMMLNGNGTLNTPKKPEKPPVRIKHYFEEEKGYRYDPEDKSPESLLTVQDFLKASSQPLAERKFAVIGINPYLDPIPGELAFAYFTLNDGIILRESFFVSPGEYAFYATMKKQIDDFKLPRPWFDEAVRERRILRPLAMEDYDDMLRKIKRPMDVQRMKIFGNEHFDYVLFAANKEVKKIQDGLTWIKGQAKSKDLKEFNPMIFPLEELIWRISAEKKHEYGNKWYKPLHTYEETKDGEKFYERVKTMACNWHQQEEIIDHADVCALHRVLSLSFMTLRILCPFFDIPLRREKHFPKEIRRPEFRCRIYYPGFPKFTADKKCPNLTDEQKAKIDKLIGENEIERSKLMEEYKQSENIMPPEVLKELAEMEFQEMLNESLKQLAEEEKRKYVVILRAETDEEGRKKAEALAYMFSANLKLDASELKVDEENGSHSVEVVNGTNACSSEMV